MRAVDIQKVQRVKKACIDIVYEIGLEGISAGKLAKRAKVSSSSIYIYFENMNDMFQVINDEITSEFFVFISQNLNEDESIKANFENIWQSAYEYCSKFPKKFIFTRRMTHSCIVQQEKSKDLKPYYQKLNNFIESAVANGAIREMAMVDFVYIALTPLYGIMKSNIENGILDLQPNDIELYRAASWKAIEK
ncbi:TetR/AcrR family transcriptional regulator [uncultured Croceitalea sp.]|uniref:TetR/AcrR family transcriptional regulator n=1 Tax=uncultured Croceitalea sp. TaxID=1798908 RepID=UPI003305E41C